MSDRNPLAFSGSRENVVRVDIQALRGWAVLVVVLYHAKLQLAPAGYLGVDIFFVISGYLITSLVARQRLAGTFDLGDFYLRRAQRLLPAAGVVVLCTILAAPLLLTQTEIAEFRLQVLGAVTFTTNFVLWKQAGYFAGNVMVKPLLHLWSLAIEQQFYLLLPLAALSLPSRWWLRSIGLAAAISLMLCVWRAGNDSTFYLLPTRGWELLLGSVAALLPQSHLSSRRWLAAAHWPACGVCLALPLMAEHGRHPGWPAMLICAATVLILLRPQAVARPVLVVTWLARLGDLSYSLYLVHWPLLSAFYSVWSGKVDGPNSLSWRLGLLLLALLLAVVLNQAVELPMRRARVQAQWHWWLGMASASLGLMLLASLWVPEGRSPRDYALVKRGNDGFGNTCALEGDFSPLPACRNSDEPELAIWGDSFAMHLVPGLAAERPKPPAMMQATRYLCGALRGLAVQRESVGQGRDWGNHCMDFNESVLRYLVGQKSVQMVVLSSPLDQYLGANANVLVRADPGGPTLAVPAQMDIALEALRRTIAALRSAGKRVVVVAPPPMAAFDIGRCLERLERELPTLNATPGCRIPLADYQGERRNVLALLARIERELDVAVIRFDDVLCDAELCSTKIDGVFVFRDNGHFTHEGSVLLAQRAQLWRQIQALAR